MKLLVSLSLTMFLLAAHANTSGSVGNPYAVEDPHFYNSNANPNNFVNPSDDNNTLNDVNEDGTRRDFNQDMKTNTTVNEVEELDIGTNTVITESAGNLQQGPWPRQHENREYTGNLQHDNRHP